MEVLRKAKVYRYWDVWVAYVPSTEERLGFPTWREAYDYAHDIQESRRHLEPCS